MFTRFTPTDHVFSVLYLNIKTYMLKFFFTSVNFSFSFVSTSLAYITILKNKRKTKITWDKKLTTTYTLALVRDVELIILVYFYQSTVRYLYSFCLLTVLTWVKLNYNDVYLIIRFPFKVLRTKVKLGHLESDQLNKDKRT